MNTDCFVITFNTHEKNKFPSIYISINNCCYNTHENFLPSMYISLFINNFCYNTHENFGNQNFLPSIYPYSSIIVAIILMKKKDLLKPQKPLV